MNRPNQLQQNGGRPRPNLEPVLSNHRYYPNSVKEGFNGLEQQAKKASYYSHAVKTSGKNKVICRSMETSEGGLMALKTVKRMFWMILSGFAPTVDTEAVKAYLE